MSKTITAYKGLDKDFACRGFQFEVGETYVHEGKVSACNSGFHVCEHPLDVLRYYKPGTSRFAMVEVSGKTDGHSEYSKLACEKLTIKAELSLAEFIKIGVEAVIARAKKTKKASNSGYQGAASNSGDYGAASNSGDYGAASNSGDYGAASNSGYQGAASNSAARGAASNSGARGAASNSGTRGAASNSGDYGAASNSGYQGAASNSAARGAASNSGARGAASNSGARGAASNSGYQGAASNSGDYGAASNSGDYGAASNSGYQGAAFSHAPGGKVMAEGDGQALYCTEFARDGSIASVAKGIAGKGGVKAGVWYTAKRGKLVAA